MNTAFSAHSFARSFVREVENSAIDARETLEELLDTGWDR